MELKDIVLIVNPIVISIIGGIITYWQSSKNLNSKIKEIEKQSELKNDEIKKQMEEQAKLYESNAKTDVAKEIFIEMFKDNNEFKKSMNQQINKSFNNYSKKGKR